MLMLTTFYDEKYGKNDLSFLICRKQFLSNHYVMIACSYLFERTINYTAIVGIFLCSPDYSHFKMVDVVILYD